MPDIYSHGHDESVLRSHRWRTAQNSCAYLIPSLQPGMELLDVGCGPGNITIELAQLVAPGRVRGIDLVAIADAADAPANVSFGTGDVYALDDGDATYDVVHAHQVLQHLSRPFDALTEMRRVLRPGGLLAVRDSDYGAFIWSPDEPLLDRWRELYRQITQRNGAESSAGRYLSGWVMAAGFVDIQAMSSTWTFADATSRDWWANVWADRVERSAFAEQALAYALSDRDELRAIAQAWRRWATQPDGFFAVMHCEVLARVRPAT